MNKTELFIVFMSGYLLNWLSEGAFILGQYLRKKFNIYGFKEAKEEYKRCKDDK